MQIIRHRACARAGLMGNPSDGFGGRTLAFTFSNFEARVVLYEWDRIEILWSQQDKGAFDSVEELVRDVQLNGYYGGVRLVKATIKRFVEYCQATSAPLHARPFSIRYDTNVPRGVGLSGSSAVVVATLRCLMEYYHVTIPLPVQASLARAVENDELGIACGLQDRVVQVYEGLVLMEFGPDKMQSIHGYDCGEYSHVDSRLLPPLYVAYDLDAAKMSGTVHTPLRVRVQQDPGLQAVLKEIADLVPQAKSALEARDDERLHQLINRNFDLRTKLYPIPQRMLDMIHTARGVGASSKIRRLGRGDCRHVPRRGDVREAGGRAAEPQ